MFLPEASSSVNPFLLWLKVFSASVRGRRATLEEVAVEVKDFFKVFLLRVVEACAAATRRCVPPVLRVVKDFFQTHWNFPVGLNHPKRGGGLQAGPRGVKNIRHRG
jgi:hypothetical protein